MKDKFLALFIFFFRSGVAEDSVLPERDAASLRHQIQMFKRKQRPQIRQMIFPTRIPRGHTGYQLTQPTESNPHFHKLFI
jgi:hypothetical protein